MNLSVQSGQSKVSVLKICDFVLLVQLLDCVHSRLSAAFWAATKYLHVVLSVQKNGIY